MALKLVMTTPLPAMTRSSRPTVVSHIPFRHPRHATRPLLSHALPKKRTFTSTARRHRKQTFSSRLREALARTRIQWAPIPVGLGIGFLGFLQFRRMQDRDKFLGDRSSEMGEGGPVGKVEKRERIRPSGPWTVQVMSTLPLKAISRLWGKFNELDIPYYLRVPGFKLYGWVFGVKYVCPFHCLPV